MLGSRKEVMRALHGFVSEALPRLLKSEDGYWQPTDLLPVMSDPDSFEQIAELQAAARELPDDLLVVLIGDMVTEEALPSYSVWINGYEGFGRMGEPQTPWGEWARRWTAEENRHGDVLNRYLYLTGRVNMREVEVTVQNLISDGGDIQTGIDPYKAFTYTSFQEIATRISHKNVAIQARAAGDERLARLCSFVAGDEHRHAKAYKLFYSKCLELDASEAIIAFHDMMKQKITMPAMYMRERGLAMGETFKKFADIAEWTGVYTRHHYIDILEHLLESWRIRDLTGLTSAAEKAQDYLCTLPDRYRKLAERIKPATRQSYRFSWLELTPPTLSASQA